MPGKENGTHVGWKNKKGECGWPAERLRLVMISPEDSTSLQIHLVQLDLVVRSVVRLLENENYNGADDDMTLLCDDDDPDHDDDDYVLPQL